MTLNIDNISTSPDFYWGLPLPFKTLIFHVDLQRSVREKLGSQQLTNDVALRILKEIKFKSDVLSLLFKPIVFIPFSILTVGSAIATLAITTNPILGVVAYAVCLVGCVMLGLSLREFVDQLLSNISKAYKQRGIEAQRLIDQITPDLTLVQDLTLVH